MFRLKKEAYYKEEYFLKEQKEIFSNSWQFVGFVEDFEDIGSYKCINIGKYHIIITRNKEKTLKAFHAECKHRGNILNVVEGSTKKSITCPYHNWTYNLDGKLVGLPERANINLKEDLYLKEANIAVFKTLVFIHPNKNSIPFEDHIKPMLSHFGPHQPELLKEYKEKYNTYLVNCNWKVFVENYIDGYHLDYLHKDTLSMYNHKQQESKFVGDHWTFVEPLTNDYLLEIKKGKSYYKPLKHLKEEDYKAHVHLLFPNLGITETESTWTIMEIIPLNSKQTKIKYRTKIDKRYSNKIKQSTEPITTSMYENPLTSGDFMIEDMYVCENIQRVLENEEYIPGETHSPKEDAILEFQEIIKKHLKL